MRSNRLNFIQALSWAVSVQAVQAGTYGAPPSADLQARAAAKPIATPQEQHTEMAPTPLRSQSNPLGGYAVAPPQTALRQNTTTTVRTTTTTTTTVQRHRAPKRPVVRSMRAGRGASYGRYLPVETPSAPPTQHTPNPKNTPTPRPVKVDAPTPIATPEHAETEEAREGEQEGSFQDWLDQRKVDTPPPTIQKKSQHSGEQGCSGSGGCGGSGSCEDATTTTMSKAQGHADAGPTLEDIAPRPGDALPNFDEDVMTGEKGASWSPEMPGTPQYSDATTTFHLLQTTTTVLTCLFLATATVLI